MKKALLFLLCALLLFFSASAVADNRGLVVYIASGSSSAYSYHASADCPSLSRSTVGTVTLEEAASNGFSPCRVCRPPSPDFSIVATPRPSSRPSNNWDNFQTASPQSSPHFTDTPVIHNPSGLEINSYTGLLSVPVVILFVVYYVRKKKQERKEAIEQEKREREAQERFESEKRSYAEKFGTLSTLSLSGAPEGCFVGNDGLPACRKGDEKWGTDYTVYMTFEGRAYHKKTCRTFNSHTPRPVNIYHAVHGSRWYHGEHSFYPCSYCRPSLPDLSWYDRYLKIQAIKKKYGIEEGENE